MARVPRPLARLALAAAAVIAAHSPPAAGNPAEVFGFGSRQAGLGGAVAARVDDFSSGYYNPAGLAFGRGKRVSFGVLGGASNLRINDEGVPLAEPFGVVFGATTPAPLGGPLANRVFVGIGLYLLPTTVIRVIAHLPDEAFYPYYDNRTQRLVVIPVIAARPIDRLSVGVGLNLLAGLAGQVVSNEGPTRGLEPRVDEQIGTTLRLNVGARYRLLETYDVAAVFRQSFSVPFTTITENTVAGEPIDLAIEAEGLFTPDQLVLGQAWRPGPVDLSLDLTWARWSAYPGPYVIVDSELPLVGPLTGVLPKVPWKDTFGVRAGAERTMPFGGGGVTWTLRGGYGFETSPIPATQRGVTNLLDGPKHTVSLGVGFFLPGKRKVRIDLHVQAQLVGERRMVKRIATGDEDPELGSFQALRDEVSDDPSEPATLGTQISNPGYPSIESGGQVFSGGLTVEVEL